MTNEVDERNKIIKSFFVVGLNENLIRKYEEETNPPRFVQDIDILVKELPKHYIPESDDEKYILLNEKKNVWLRIKYSSNYNTPITDLQIAECDYESNEYLLLEKKYINENCYPMMISYSKNNNSENNDNKEEIYPIFSEFKLCKEYNSVYVKIPSELNIKNLILLGIKAPSAIFLITRKYTSLPLKDLSIIRKGGGNFNISKVKHKPPYIFKYIPEILDQYPPEIEKNSSVSMFCFPEGLKISSQYHMPSWFTFVLTDEVGNRTYGSTVVFWEEMDIKLKENFIPFFDEYDPKTQKRKYYFIQKAICILSKFPFYYNCKLFLKQLYKIQTASKSLIPLERVICTFVDSLYLQSQEIVQFIIGEEKLNFYRIANYGELWDTNNNYLEVLFRVLSFKQIVTAWQALLLEKKLFLLCSSKATLSCVAHGLINLLFPFKWIHVLIPILPEKLKLFIDTPIPLIIGISFPCDLNEFPNDAIILNINKNKFENYYNSIPKLKGKLQASLEKKLRLLKEKYQIDNPIKSDMWMDYQDNAFPTFELDKHIEIDHREIRETFYSIFISIFKNYDKFIDWDTINEILNSNNPYQEDIIEKCFKKREFLKSHSATEEDDFISIFSETSLFNQFFEPFLKIKTDGPMGYFLECIKNRKVDKKLYLQEIIPDKIIKLPEIDISDLKGEQFFHVTFPSKLNQNLYIQIERPKKPFKSRFIKYEDEWCFNIFKLKKRDWPRYLLYLIYEIWFHFFSFIIHFYSDQDYSLLMDFAIFVLEDLHDNKKIVPTRRLFSKIFKSCGRSELNIFVKRILILVNKTYKNTKFNNLFCNSYLSGLYALTENIGKNNSITLASANSYLNITAIRLTILNEMYADNYDTKNLLENILFLNAKICSNCVLNKKKLYKMSVEQILAGFSLNKDNPYIICPECLCKIEPYIYYLKKSQNNLKPQSFKLIHPQKLIDDIDKLINEEGEIFFYKKFEDKKLQYLDIYLSIIFYFKLFDLPLFVLYTPKNKGNSIINDLIEQIRLNKLRKLEKINKRKSKRDISPDRKSKSPDKSLDKNSYISGDYTDISRKTTLSGLPELEKEIWKNIQNNLNNEIIDNKLNNNEKNEFDIRYKDIKIVLSKHINYFILESSDNLDKFLNKINQNPENEMEFEFNKNEFGKIIKNNITNINNIKIQTNKEKGEEKIKQRNIGGNNINLNNFNLEKKKQEEDKKEDDKNVVDKKGEDNKKTTNGNFSGFFEDQKEEKEETKKKNNWMDKKDEECNINIISEYDEIDEKKFKSSNELSFKPKQKNQTTSNKNLNEIGKPRKISEFDYKEKNKIEKEDEKEENKKNDNQKDNKEKDEEPIRKKSEVVRKKKKIAILFE